ncbi:MAG TPA: hypothetical protein VFI91_05300 [Longimicrobiaceae bacterium]|nr:hypothetical protein [Longimicrobiaceae bacterium]
MAEPSRREKATWIQAALVLLFFALLMAYFIVPVGDDSDLRPHWWTWLIVAAPAAGALFIQLWRRGPRR